MDSHYLEIKKLLQNWLELQNNALHKFGNNRANINIKNCSLFIILMATDPKLQKSFKGHITQPHIGIQAM